MMHILFNFYPKLRCINPILEFYLLYCFSYLTHFQKNFRIYCVDNFFCLFVKNQNGFGDLPTFINSCWNRSRSEARWGCKFFCIGLKISVCLRSCLLIGCSILIFGKWKVGRRTQCVEIIFWRNILDFSRDSFIWFS